MFNNLRAHQGGYPNPTVAAKFAQSANDFTTLLTTTSMPSGGSVSRSGQAMVYDSTGKLTYAPNNLLTYSQDFTNAVWAPLNAGTGSVPTVTGNNQVAPDGTTTAETVVFNKGAGTTGSDYSIIRNAGVAVVAGNYVISFYIKAASNCNITAYFNTGTIVYTNVAVTTSWQRVTITSTLASSATGYLTFGLVGNDSTGNSSATVYLWGAQLEAVTYQTTPSTYVATTTAAYYGPRFDYDPSTLAAKGLLIEGTRTNLSYPSNTFTSPWGSTGTPAPTTTNVAPDGTSTAYAWSVVSGSTGYYRFLTLSATTQYTFSSYVKAVSGAPTIQLGSTTAVWGGSGGTSVADITFNASTKAFSAIGAGVQSYGYQDVGNGWLRVYIVATTNATPGSVGFVCYVTNASTTAAVWGVQIEAGAFPSSLTVTTSASVARAAETFSITGYTNRLLEAYYIDQQTNVSSSLPETVVSSGAVTISPPTFGWVTSLRAYTNAYAGSIASPSWLSFSRSGNAMMTDSTGTLTYAPANMWLYSQDFSQGATNINIVSTNNADPIGTNSATLLNDGTAASTYHGTSKSISLIAGQTYIASVYVKDGGRRYANIAVYANASFYLGAVFDLTSVSAATTTLGTGYSVISTNIIPVTGYTGWYRCSVVFTVGVGGNNTFWIASANSTTLGTYGLISYTGTSAQLYYFGAQVEPVTYQTQPSAYIPTTTAAVYGPRYDYDASTVPATPRGLLIEESRANIVPYSQSFNLGGWTLNNLLAFGSGSTLNTTATISPDGTNTSALLVPNTTGSVAHSFYYNNVTVTAQAYTFSVYVKAAGYNWIALGNMSTGGSVYFNISTGAVGSNSAGYAGAISSVGNGWYRCTVTWTATAGSFNPGFYIATGDGGNVYAGNGTSGIYVWGYQLEAGSFATSYIPTTSASVTRAADVAQLTGSALTTLQGANFSALTEFTLTNATATSAAAGRFIGLTATPAFQMPFAANSVSSIISNANGVNLTASVSLTAKARVGYAQSATGRSLVGNAGTITTDANSIVSVTDAFIGSRTSGLSYATGWYGSVALYNQRLPDAILKQKSAIGAPY